MSGCATRICWAGTEDGTLRSGGHSKAEGLAALPPFLCRGSGSFPYFVPPGDFGVAETPCSGSRQGLDTMMSPGPLALTLGLLSVVALGSRISPVPQSTLCSKRRLW